MARSKTAETALTPDPAEPLVVPEDFVQQETQIEDIVPLTESPEPVAQKHPARFLPLALGGAVASVLGFGAALYLAKAYPDFLAVAGSTGIEQRLSDQDRRLSDLAAALAAMPNAETAAGLPDELRSELDTLLAAQGVALTKVQARQDAIEAQIKATNAQLQGLKVSGGGVATNAQIIAATEAAAKQVGEAQAEAERQQAEAAVTVRKATASAALGEIQAAFESGAALDAALLKLSDTGIVVPQALSAQAQGVPTMAALREGFAPAARGALAASLAETAGDGLWDRIGAFLRSQTGARSLSPKAGGDPDAVLSRAESALGNGDLAAALTEIEALPEAGRARMGEWTTLMARRLAAEAAITALVSEVK